MKQKDMKIGEKNEEAKSFIYNMGDNCNHYNTFINNTRIYVE